MKERPILFSPDMVKAILLGEKSQTRRVVLPQWPGDSIIEEMSATTPEGWQTIGHSGHWWDAGCCSYQRYCPYGVPGDRLWVREAWQRVEAYDGYGCCYRADEQILAVETDEDGNGLDQLKVPHVELFDVGDHPWRPSIYMPRGLSRINLTIKNIRVERVQSISEADCIAEGFKDIGAGDLLAMYANKWNVLNAKRGFPWSSNPWVWVIEFDLTPNPSPTRGGEQNETPEVKHG